MQAASAGTITRSSSLQKLTNRVRQPGSRPVQFLDRRGARTHLAHDGVSAGQWGDGRAPVRCAEGDQGADPLVTAQPLYVIAGDQAAEAVPDDVDLVVSGAGADLLDVPAEQLGCRTDVAGQRRVVE